MKRYEVHYAESCAACKGSGLVQHPAWEQYWNLYPADDNVDDDTIAARMAEFGWHCTPRRKETPYGSHIHAGLPPEEEPCSECEGAGQITGTCELREALSDIGIDWSAIVKQAIADAAYNAQLSAELADAQAFAQAWDR